MRYSSALFPTFIRRPHRRGRRGMALITTLLLLMLLTALGVTMVLTVSSDLLINGYYRNFRGSFYAADSGLNVARLDLDNLLVNGGYFSATFDPASEPLGSVANRNTVAGNVKAALIAKYGNADWKLAGAAGTGQAAGSWPGQFRLDAANTDFTYAPCSGAAGSCGSVAAGGYTYSFNYTLSAVGKATGAGSARATERGTMTVFVPASDTQTKKQSFAGWGTFIDQYPICSAPFVPGTLTGPFFTNGAWTFDTSGPYIFTDSTGSHSAKAGYDFGNNGCDQVAGPQDTKNGKTIKPTFQSGFNLGQPAVPLPTDSFDQKRAVLDGMGMNDTDPSNAEMHNVLRNVNGTQYSSSGQSTGVWLPFSVDSSGNKTFTGGGILVEGNADSIKLSTSGATAQVYEIKQGATTTKITIDIDPNANTTTVESGSVTQVINGTPMMYDSTTGAPTSPATMLYVDCNIGSSSTNRGLSGPSPGVAAIQDGSALTITAHGTVTITGDIIYKTEPVTTTQNQIVPGTSPACCNNTPADTLIPGHDHGQVLGIFTDAGDIQMDNQQSSGNLEIDASIAMISAGGSGGWINVGNHINTLTLIGGRIANQAKSGNTTTRNIFFDRRFANGIAPPWYPSTTVTITGTDTTGTPGLPSYSRVYWVVSSAY